MTALLDPFLPRFDVRDRYEVTIHAPAAMVMELARAQDFGELPLVRAIFALRGLLMGASPEPLRMPRGVVAGTRRLGWGCLADLPGRAYVAGATCEPWQGDVHFEAVPPERFAAAAPPRRVKIAWTLEAEPLGPDTCRFATETRALATDAEARTRFAGYWRWARLGIVAIRRLAVPALRRDAERRWREEVRRRREVCDQRASPVPK